jgi:hypothetical protein
VEGDGKRLARAQSRVPPLLNAHRPWPLWPRRRARARHFLCRAAARAERRRERGRPGPPPPLVPLVPPSPSSLPRAYFLAPTPVFRPRVVARCLHTPNVTLGRPPGRAGVGFWVCGRESRGARARERPEEGAPTLLLPPPTTSSSLPSPRSARARARARLLLAPHALFFPHPRVRRAATPRSRSPPRLLGQGGSRAAQERPSPPFLSAKRTRPPCSFC